MKSIKKIWKYLLRFVLFTFLFLLVVAALIQIPAVQSYLTTHLETYLQNKLKTEVRIESLRLKLPESLALGGVYIEDLEKDTLLSVGELTVNFKLNQLLQRRVQFDRIALEEGQAKLHFGKESSNLDFIINAFSGGSENVENELIANDPTNPWVMVFDDAAFHLRQVEFEYSNEASAIDLAAFVGELKGSVGQLDYLKNDYQVNQISLSNASVKLKIGEADSITTVNSSEAVEYKIGAQKIGLENVEVELSMPDMDIAASIGRLENGNSFFYLNGDDLQFQTPRFLLSESQFRYDVPSAVPLAKGFDPNHFGLENIEAKMADFVYDNLEIAADLRQLSGQTSDGFLLKKLQGKIAFSKNNIALREMDLETASTNLKSKKTTIEYPFLGGAKTSVNQLKLEVGMEAQSDDLSDLSYFYPPIDSFSFFQKNSDKPLKINAIVKGSLADLHIQQLDFEGFQSKVIANGKIKNPTHSDRLELDLSLSHFFAPKEAIASVLPDSLLPAYLQLPDSIFLSGNIKGSLRDFNSNLQAVTKRNGVALPTRINAQVQLKNIQNLDSTQINILLDTFVISKPDLIAYLPPGTLPDYVDLPDEFVLAGRVVGPMSNLQSDLQLLTFRAGSKNQFEMLGGITGLFTSSSPSFDLSLDAANVGRGELAAFLPDSLLPAYLQLPVLNKLTGIFRGDLNDFKSNFQLESNTGKWAVEAALKEEKFGLDLAVQELQPASFFKENYLDSLAGFSIRPLTVEIKLDGQGFDFSKETFADFLVKIKSSADTTMGGLEVKGKLNQQILTAHATANEPEIQLQSDLRLDASNDLPQLLLDLQLDQLDLQKLHLHDLPFALNGHFSVEAKGTGLDTLLGQLLADDLGIHFNGKSEQIDSLLLMADMDNGKSSIRLTSDFMDAKLEGEFRFPQVVDALRQMVNSAWQPSYTDSLIGKTDDHFAFECQLHRPEILMMGYIHTLEVLTPFQLAADFDNCSPKLHLQTDVPFLRYQQSDFEDVSFRLDGSEKGLDYDFGLRHAIVQDIAEVKNFSTFGKLEEGDLTNTLQVLDKEKKERFALNSSLRFLENETLLFSFLPNQLLNYEKWQVSENNAVRFSDNELEVKDWRFSKGKSAIEIFTKKEGGLLKVAFEKFDLKTISDIIKLESDYLGGILNGSLVGKNIFEKPSLTAQLNVDGLLVMSAPLGDLNVKVTENNERVINATASLKGNGNDLSLRGDYSLNEKFEPLDFLLDISAIDLSAIEPLTLGYLEKMEGELAGRLEITGNFEQPSVEGSVQLKEAAFDIEMLKARLRLGEQPIIFDANAIEFQDLEILDAEGNKGIVSSYILTTDYRNYFLQADVAVNDFLILNTTAEDNDLYYGKLLVDATAKLTGALTEPTVEVVAKPKKNSKLTYIYNPYSNDLVTHDGVVEFIVPADLHLPKPRQKTQIEEVSEGLNMKITVLAEVNEDLDFITVTDPISGDNFEGKAKGDIVFVMQPDGTMELNGQLEAVEGKYLFTYQRLLRRPFDVKPGGTLTWTGDPFNPKLNVDVEYKVRTSAYPLLVQQGTAQEGASTAQKQNFLVKLNIGGVPSKTEIATSIDYPNDIDGNTGASEIQTAITNINQDPSQQNTQAFSLILFNGFLSQNLGNSDFKVVDISGNINNVITQQLNGLANRYIKFVEVDFGLNTYANNDNNSQSDFRVSVRKRFLNDRLVISLDGKTTTETGTEQSSSQTYLDNVTVEYALTPNGRFKIKLYNQRDYDDFIGGTAVKLGGALVFSKDFNGARFSKK